LNRHVASKFLPTELTADAERRMRFEREAQATAALNHPNIAVIHEVGEHQGAPFIVMEYLEGRGLREALKGRSLSTTEWIEIALPIAEALHHAHERGVVHRDLKPDNLLVTDDDQVKILDFGLAKLVQTDKLPEGADVEVHTALDTISKELTVAGKVFGTVTYMSPEQARGETVDHRSDLFSFGILLYRMATGKLPFAGKSEIETLSGILNAESPPLVNVTDEGSGEVERIVHKAMEKEVDRRYQHADDLATDLRNLQRDLDSGKVSMPVSVAPAKSGRGIKVAGGLLAVALLAVVGWVLTRSGAPPETAHADRVVAVMGFENVTAPDDADNLGRIMTGLLNTDLAESGGLRMVAGTKVLASFKEAGAADGFDASVASRAARIAGAQVMVVGQVIRNGDRIIVTAELADVDSGNTFGSIRGEANSDDEVFSLAGTIAEDVRRNLGVDEDTLGSAFDLSESLTASPEAYGYFNAGSFSLHDRNWDEAIDLYSRAVRIDPTFALAYYRKGIAETWAGYDFDSTASFQRALEEGAALPERWRTLITGFLLYNEGDWDAAYDTIHPLIEEEPDFADAHYLIGEILFHGTRYIDYPRARIAFERALELDPTYRVAASHIFDSLVLADDAARIERLIEELRRENPSSVAALYGESALLVGQGRDEEFRTLIREGTARGLGFDETDFGIFVLGSRSWDLVAKNAESMLANSSELIQSWGYQARGLRHLVHGRFVEGLDDVVKSVELEKPAGPLYGRDWSSFEYIAATILLETGNVAAALDLVPRTESDPFDGQIFYLRGALLFRAGEPGQGEEVLDALRRMSEQSLSPITAFWIHMLAAEKHLALGDTTAALVEMEACRAMAREERARRFESVLYARVLAASGRTKEAIAAYREFLNPPHLNTDFLIDEIPALYEIARLEEAAGELDAARGYYRQYLDHWGEADLPVSNVPDARARLKALAGHE
jgi:non-specific serine/threonine protein kinase